MARRLQDAFCFTLQSRDQGHLQLLQLLLEAGAKKGEPEFAQGWTPSFTTVRNHHLNTPCFRIENGAAKGQGVCEAATPWLSAADDAQCRNLHD